MIEEYREAYLKKLELSLPNSAKAGVTGRVEQVLAVVKGEG